MKKCLAFLFSFFFFSCDNEIPIDENFVVEAFLFQGEVVDDIKIKEAKMWNSTDSITDYIENADVIIFGNGTEYKLDYNSQFESYVTNQNIDIVSGDTYGLEVTVGDRTATGETIVPIKPVGLRLSTEEIVIPRLVLSSALPNILAGLYETARTSVIWDNPNNEYHYLTCLLYTSPSPRDS